MLRKKISRELFVPKHSAGNTRAPLCVWDAHMPHTTRKQATALNCFGTCEVWARGPAKQREIAASTWIFWDIIELQPLLISQFLHHMLPKSSVSSPSLSHSSGIPHQDRSEGGLFTLERHPSHRDFCALWSLCLLQPVSRASEQTPHACPSPHVPLFSRNSTKRSAGWLKSVLRFI